MNAPARPTPFDLVFESLALERFAALREGIAAAGRDPRDQDGFLLVQEAGELLRDLRPEEGLGVGVSTLAALVHSAYLFWIDGRQTSPVSEPTLLKALAGEADPASTPRDELSRYVQLPALRVWGTPVEGGTAEPLDGWFARRDGERLLLVAVFGLHPGRDGLSAVAASGSRPQALARMDGSPLFAPTLPGGAAAGLASVTGEEELLELAWRLEATT